MRRNRVIYNIKFIPNIKGGRKKAQYYIKKKTEYYCNNCGRKKI